MVCALHNKSKIKQKRQLQVVKSNLLSFKCFNRSWSEVWFPDAKHVKQWDTELKTKFFRTKPYAIVLQSMGKDLMQIHGERTWQGW
jgi:hypothetical protein